MQHRQNYGLTACTDALECKGRPRHSLTGKKGSSPSQGELWAVPPPHHVGRMSEAEGLETTYMAGVGWHRSGMSSRVALLSTSMAGKKWAQPTFPVHFPLNGNDPKSSQFAGMPDALLGGLQACVHVGS